MRPGEIEMPGRESRRDDQEDIRRLSKMRKRKEARFDEGNGLTEYFNGQRRLKGNDRMDSLNILAKCAAKELKQLGKKIPGKENRESGENGSETDSEIFDIEFPCVVTGGKKMYKCTFSGCTKEFPSLSRMRRHYIIHTGAKPFKCLSSKCHKSFSRRDNMIQHYKGHCSHSDKK